MKTNKMKICGSGTNEIVELFPAPVEPTQMTQARGKERSLTSMSFIAILNIYIISIFNVIIVLYIHIL